MIHTGDCIEVMQGMPADSVDAVVTDPPAGIAFMSKHWDRDKGGRTQWVAWMTEVMSECYRVLKPGGYAVVWSLPRTCHWTAWAMEDAGFIIRDQLAHIFASGFPKGKAQLKPAREDWWLARKPGPLQPLNIEETRITGEPRTTHTDGNRRTANKGPTMREGLALHDDPWPAPAGRWPSNILLSDPELFDEPNPWVVGAGPNIGSIRPPVTAGKEQGPGLYEGRIGVKAEGDEYVGYGDSGGYSRFFIIPKADRVDREPVLRGQLAEGYHADLNKIQGNVRYENRCPECDASLPYGTKEHCGKPTVKRMAPNTLRTNIHPTTKPTDLMRHLVRLVTPSGGTVLDPFLGSGSTAIAAEMEGFAWVGIEKEPEYVAIAEARLNGTQRGLGLDVPAGVKTPKRGPGYWPKRRAPADGYSGEWAGRDDKEPAA